MTLGPNELAALDAVRPPEPPKPQTEPPQKKASIVVPKKTPPKGSDAELDMLLNTQRMPPPAWWDRHQRLTNGEIVILSIGAATVGSGITLATLGLLRRSTRGILGI